MLDGLVNDGVDELAVTVSVNFWVVFPPTDVAVTVSG
jgi:hypothetical protein